MIKLITKDYYYKLLGDREVIYTKLGAGSMQGIREAGFLYNSSTLYFMIDKDNLFVLIGSLNLILIPNTNTRGLTLEETDILSFDNWEMTRVDENVPKYIIRNTFNKLGCILGGYHESPSPEIKSGTWKLYNKDSQEETTFYIRRINAQYGSYVRVAFEELTTTPIQKDLCERKRNLIEIIMRNKYANG